MKKSVVLGIMICTLIIISCDKEKKITNSLREYSLVMQEDGLWSALPIRLV